MLFLHICIVYEPGTLIGFSTVIELIIYCHRSCDLIMLLHMCMRMLIWPTAKNMNKLASLWAECSIRHPAGHPFVWCWNNTIQIRRQYLRIQLIRTIQTFFPISVIMLFLLTHLFTCLPIVTNRVESREVHRYRIESRGMHRYRVESRKMHS